MALINCLLITDTCSSKSWCQLKEIKKGNHNVLKVCFGFSVIQVGYNECRAVAKQVLLPVRKATRVLWLNAGERYTSVVSPALVKSEDNQIAVAQKVCWRLTYTGPREVDRSLVEGRHKPIGAWKLKMEFGVVVHVQKHPLCSEKKICLVMVLSL